MEKHLKYSVILLASVICFYSIGYSQSTYQVIETTGYDVKLLGTSTLRAWELGALTSTGEAQFVFRSGSETDLVSIGSFSFSFKVGDLKSDTKMLDKSTYEALKLKEHKHILYKLTSATLSPENGGFLIKSKGKLTIARVTKEIIMDVHGVINDDGTVTSKGSYKLNMTDYNVQPPSFFLGTVKTGNAITLNFTVVYKKEEGV